MTRSTIAILLSAIGLVCNGGEALQRFELLKTRDGRVYRSVEVSKVTTDYIVATWEGGLGAIRIDNLPDEVLTKLGLRTRAEREEQDKKFREEQRAKGLVEHAGKWISLAEKEEIERAARDSKRAGAADKLVMMKCRKGASFKVFQSLPHGLLCIMAEPGAYTGRLYYTGETFFLHGATRATVGEGEKYTGDLYWAGTHTYTTVQGIERTINSYALDKDSARGLVLKKLGNLRDDRPGEKGKHTQEETPDGAVSYGSGFLATEDGHIITNNHVVSGARAIRVKTESALLEAKLIGRDPENDIALLKVQGTFVPLTFSKRASAAMGETVFTLGFPMPTVQGFSPKITKGVISSLKGIKDDVRMYQIDAAVQPGNSGSPLADANGHVIGMVVARLNDAFAARPNSSVFFLRNPRKMARNARSLWVEYV